MYARFSPDARRDLDGVANPVRHRRFSPDARRDLDGVANPVRHRFFLFFRDVSDL
jgi:hypothetical protein